MKCFGICIIIQMLCCYYFYFILIAFCHVQNFLNVYLLSLTSPRSFSAEQHLIFVKAEQNIFSHFSQKIVECTRSKPKSPFFLIVKTNCDHMDWKGTEQKLVKIDLGIIPIMMKHLCLSSARGKQGYRCSITSATIWAESLQHTCCALHDNQG